MQYRFSLTRKLVRSLAVLALLLPLQGARAEGPDGARIVNGLSTHDLPTVAVLLSDFLGEAEFAIGFCSGTLIGCQTVLTAAHCVDGATASNSFVFLQNVGTVSVSSITIHPSYMGANFPIADVAVLKLGSLVTGVDPTEINQIDPSSVIPGASGTIAGYGITLGSQNDFGLKRFGRIKTANCNGSIPAGAGNTEVICWDYETPVGSPGDDSNTCNGDSGGPLFMDLGAGNVVAGTTSGGFVDDCDTDDHSYNVNVYTYRRSRWGRLRARRG
ncbi:MAG: trypsin-like serine protease [Deltaproteobacteria bacterium]|nr:trypsin-like serine protease [Deltaproteobacteria bacterium]